MPDGLSSARSPSRVSVSVADPADTSERLDTSREAASAPDIVQPPAPDVPAARTGSLSVTRISRSEAATAPATRGAWPSASARGCDEEGPRALPAASTSTVWSMVKVPVAFVAAAAPSNVTVWVAEAAPVGPVGVREPPSVRDRAEYAAGTRVTGSLYTMVRAFGPVTLADRTAGAWPSASARGCDEEGPRALPAASTSTVWSMVKVPVAFVAAAAPSNVTVWVAEAAPVGPVGVREPPSVRDRAEYAAGTRVTGSLYTMVRAFGPVTLADRTAGAWPSASERGNAALVPRALPDASDSAVWFMVSVPVAFAAAAVSGRKSPNSRTCVADPFPVNTPGTPRSPPGDRARPAYADAPM